MGERACPVHYPRSPRCAHELADAGRRLWSAPSVDDVEGVNQKRLPDQDAFRSSPDRCRATYEEASNRGQRGRAEGRRKWRRDSSSCSCSSSLSSSHRHNSRGRQRRIDTQKDKQRRREPTRRHSPDSRPRKAYEVSRHGRSNERSSVKAVGRRKDLCRKYYEGSSSSESGESGRGYARRVDDAQKQRHRARDERSRPGYGSDRRRRWLEASSDSTSSSATPSLSSDSSSSSSYQPRRREDKPPQHRREYRASETREHPPRAHAARTPAYPAQRNIRRTYRRDYSPAIRTGPMDVGAPRRPQVPSREFHEPLRNLASERRRSTEADEEPPYRTPEEHRIYEPPESTKTTTPSVWGEGFGVDEERGSGGVGVSSMRKDGSENITPPSRTWTAPRGAVGDLKPPRHPTGGFWRPQRRYPLDRDASWRRSAVPASDSTSAVEVPRDPEGVYYLNICLPIEIPEGTIYLAGGAGENFYKFPKNVEGKVAPAALFFTPDDGVCDCWASFLHVRIASIPAVPFHAIEQLLKAFEVAMHGSQESHKFMIDKPIQIYCKGLYPTSLEKAVTSDSAKDGCLETRGYLATVDDLVNFRALRRRLQLLVTLLQASTELPYLTAGTLRAEEGFFLSLINDEGATRSPGGSSPSKSKKWLQNKMKEATAEVQWMLEETKSVGWGKTGSPNIVFRSCILDKGPWPCLPIVVNEWRQVGKRDLEVSLSNDEAFIQQNIVRGVQISEIRLEYQAKRTLDPRFPNKLIMTRQLLGVEDPHFWNKAKRVIVQKSDTVRYPGIKSVLDTFLERLPGQLLSGKHNTTKEAIDAALDGLVVPFEEGEISNVAKDAEERALHLFCTRRGLPVVEEDLNTVCMCVTGRFDFVYQRHLYRKHILGRTLLPPPRAGEQATNPV